MGKKTRLEPFPMLVAAALGLGACAPGPEIGAYADGDPRSARLLLEEVNRSAPMPVALHGPIPGNLTAPAIVEALGANILGMSASLAAQPEPPDSAPRVIVLFGPSEQLSPWRACDPSSRLEAGVSAPRRIVALVCDGPSTVAHLRAAAASDSADDVTRLMRQVGRNLFADPDYERYRYDPYGGYYGGFGSFGSYGSRVGVGVGFGF